MLICGFGACRGAGGVYLGLAIQFLSMLVIFITGTGVEKTPKYTTMKITEYARINQAWQPVREYYWFAPEEPRDTENLRPPRRPCPGCGRDFSAAFIRAHECLGGRPGYPRLPNARTKNLISQDPERLREYMRSRRHHTITTGD